MPTQDNTQDPITVAITETTSGTIETNELTILRAQFSVPAADVSAGVDGTIILQAAMTPIAPEFSQYIEGIRDEVEADRAEVAQNTAQVEALEQQSLAHRDAAASSETNAAESLAQALSAETRTLASEDRVDSAESRVAALEGQAGDHEARAGEWAEQPENVEVVAGQFSALHHSRKAEDFSTASESSATSASASQTAAAASEAASQASETAAAASESAAALSEANSAASESAAQSSQSAAAVSASNALTSEGNAAASAQASETSAQSSEASRQSSEAAQTGSIAARDKAERWADETVDVEVEPGKFSARHGATKADGSRIAAEQAESTAITKAGEASASAAASQSSATNSAASEANALASELKAEQWADLGEDDEVEPGRFSSQHWAIKAEKSAAGGMSYRGSWDASTGVYPVSPQAGWLYKVDGDGTVDGVEYLSGDSIIYNGGTATASSGWDRIDNTERVTSVAGKIGSVVLNKADVGLDLARNVSSYSQTEADSLLAGKLDDDANAVSASKLLTARTIALSGDASGSATFDGSANATISVVIADDSHNHLIANVDGLQAALNAKLDGTAKAADADKLDGLDSAQFVRADLPQTVGGLKTYTADAVFQGASPTIKLDDTNADDFFLRANGNTFYVLTDRDDSGAGTAGGWEGAVPLELRNVGSEAFVYGNKVWHAGNDGPGSGLSADTVDGLQATQFLRSDVDTTCTARLSFGNTTRQMLNLWGGNYGIGVQSNTTYVRTDGRFSVHKSGTHSDSANDPGAGGSTVFTVSPTEILHGDDTVWTSGNDGPGSGLDADTLDGLNASQLLRSDIDQTYAQTLTFADSTEWQVSQSDVARQRCDARDDAANFSRLHWFAYSDAAGVSNFRHAWYDGASYINVTAAAGTVTFAGKVAATSFEGKATDADKLDGLDSSQFLRSDTSDTINGDLTITGEIRSTSTISFFNGTSALPINTNEILVSNQFIDRSKVPTNGAYIKGLVQADGGFSGNGSSLTALNANNLGSGTVPTARLPAEALTGDTTYTAGNGIALSGTQFSVSGGDGLTQLSAGLSVDSTVVRTSRAVATGDGLTGGGNLSANRTLAVDASVLRTTGDQSIAGTKTLSEYLKLENGSSIYSKGSGHASHRTIFRACEYRSAQSGASGAFVIKAPTTGTVMHQFHIKGMLYNGGKILDTVVQVYRSGSSVTHQTRVIHKGTETPTIRTGRDAADLFCLIVGDEGENFSYPHIVVDKLLISHSSAGDAYATGWTITQETDLSSFIDVSAPFSVAGTLFQTADQNKLDGIAAGAEVNVPTNLTQSRSATTYTVGSSTGSNTTLAAASTTQAGVMTGADKSKLNGIEPGAQVNINTNLGQSRNTISYTVTSSTGTGTTLAAATTSAAGVMSSADKSKLNGIESGAEVNSVTSVAGKTGAVTVTQSDVGLGSVRNVASYSQAETDTAFLRSNAPDTLTAQLTLQSNLVVAEGHRNHGLFGTYVSTKTSQIWSMGTQYTIPADGSDFGSLYGLAYKHTNNATGGTMAGGHQGVWCSAGTPKSAIGDNIWTAGEFRGDGGGLTGTAALRATGTTKADVGLGLVRNVASYSQTEMDATLADYVQDTEIGTMASRDVFISTASPTSGDGQDGDIWLQY